MEWGAVMEVVEWAVGVMRECGREEEALRVERALEAEKRRRVEGAGEERAEVMVPTRREGRGRWRGGRRVPDFDERFF